MLLSIGLLTLLIVSYWAVLRRFFPSIVAPASIWLLGWSTLFGVCALLGWDYTFKWNGVFVILIGVLIFPIGCLFGATPSPKPNPDAIHGQQRAEFKWLIRFGPAIQVATALVGVVGAVALSHHFGRSLLSLASFAEISLAANANGALIESGEEVMPAFSSVAFAVLQVGFICSGILVAAKGMGLKPAALLLMLLGVVAMWTLVTTIRSYFVASVVWFVSSYVATKIALRAERSLIKPSTVVISVIGVAGLVALIIISQSFRMGDYNFVLVGAAAAHLRPWAAGYIPGFTYWYDQLLRNPTADPGGSSIIRGISAVLGVTQHKAFDRGTTLIQIGGGETTNAITVFKTIIGDYGFVGGMFFTFWLGFFGQRSYEWCRKGSLAGLGAFSAFVAAILWSPNAWFFKYGSRILALMLFFAVVAGIKLIFDFQRNRVSLKVD